MGIKCCLGCVAPKRYPGCHDHCDEYLTEKAEHIRIKEMEYERRNVWNSVYSQKSMSILRALKRRGGS